ncbi:MAG TPA: hypothetical protein VKP08_01625 [Anaerolineales bacterium]|nr:hypothetical protein [Anaerolineales bacterium]
MDDSPFYRRPGFYIAWWLAVLLIIYGWSIWSISKGDGIQNHLTDIFVDLACIFPALLVLWLAFFAQFVLPVHTFPDRQKIFERLISYLLGSHGPTLFIENGVIKEHVGERDKKGPGVLWLDSASAAVTRTAVAIKQVMGPGVHFTSGKEFIAGTLDLHIQSQTIGPKDSDRPFEDKRDNQTTEEYEQIQERRKQVSAWMRDGIEVIPNISVSFRVNTGFPKEGQPGSRFGYRTGVTKKDKENEKRDKEAIRRVILGEGINPNAVQDSPRRRVAWNELPGALAADLWREYAAKFTLDQFFQPDQLVPPPEPSVPQPTEEEIDPLSQPIQVSSNRDAMQNNLAKMVREVNLLMSRTITRLEGKKESPEVRKPTAPQLPAATPRLKKEPERKTALQVINEMVKARLTQDEVDILDDHGVRGDGKVPSPEYKLLQERGIEVKSVSISTLRFDPTIEEAIINRWTTTWLRNAKTESEQIERRRNLVETGGEEQAIRQYADLLSKDLIQKKPKDLKETLKTLLMRTRTLINNPQLRQRMSEEQQDLEEIIRWIEGT